MANTPETNGKAVGAYLVGLGLGGQRDTLQQRAKITNAADPAVQTVAKDILDSGDLSELTALLTGLNDAKEHASKGK